MMPAPVMAAWMASDMDPPRPSGRRGQVVAAQPGLSSAKVWNHSVAMAARPIMAFAPEAAATRGTKKSVVGVAERAMAKQTAQTQSVAQAQAIRSFKIASMLIGVGVLLAAASLEVLPEATKAASAVITALGCFIAAGAIDRFRSAGSRA